MKEKIRHWGWNIKTAFPTTIPVLTGFLVLGLAYGMLMNSIGYGPWWSLLFSMAAFCGSMQFVAITFLVQPFVPLQCFLMTLMVNARHLFYGLSMLEKYKGTGKKKGFLIYYLCDETFAITSSSKVPDGMDKSEYYLTVTALDASYWWIASFLGGVLGNMLAISMEGLDFALTALFVVLFIDQLKTKTNAISGLIGLGSTALCLILFGADNLVIPAMILIVAILLAGRKHLCG